MDLKYVRDFSKNISHKVISEIYGFLSGCEAIK